MSIAEVPKSHKFNRQLSKTPPYSQPTSAAQHEHAHLKSLDDLGALNFYCFGGRRDFCDGFRALVVGGGGTSQSAVDLAEQLRGTGGAVVYVDASEQAIDIAQDRARTRGVCDDIEWIQAAPLDLPGVGLEPFDYVNCCGMLQMLPEPAAALNSLKPILKPDGALGLSFRGKYGRTGVDQLRDLMGIVNHDTHDAGDAIARTRAIIDRLPATNWCKRAVDLFPIYDNLSDAEIHDLFLSQHSVFSIPDVWELLDAAGLFLVEHTREQRALCEPLFAFPDGPLLKQIQQLPRRDQQAATELYWGAITRHTFWASRRPDTIAALTDPDMIPFFTRFAESQDVQESILSTAGDEWSWTTRLAGEVDVSITFHVAPAARRFVELIDDRRTLAEIVETILSAYNPRPPIKEAMKISRYVMEVLLRQDLLLVRHKSTLPQPQS